MDRIPALLLQQIVGHPMSDAEVNPFLCVPNTPCSAVDHGVAETAGGSHHQVTVPFLNLQHKVLPAVVPQQVGVRVPLHSTYLTGPRRATGLSYNLGLLHNFWFFSLDWAVYNRVKGDLKPIFLSLLLLRSQCTKMC